MRSLRTRLGLLWLLILATCVSLALIMLGMYRQGAAVQIGEARTLTQSACESIRSQYARSLAKQAGAPGANGANTVNTDLLNVLLQLTLAETPGVEGGIWHRDEGFLAYAFPTYEGAGEKRDVPNAERPNIEQIAGQSARAEASQDSFQRGAREALVLSACPLIAADHALAAWTMKRVPAAAADTFDRLRLGLALLLAFVLVSGVWVGLLLHRWSRRLEGLEKSLSEHTIDELPKLAPTGEAELVSWPH